MIGLLTLIQIDEETDWQTIKPEVFATIMDFFTSGLPVIHEGTKDPEQTCNILQMPEIT